MVGVSHEGSRAQSLALSLLFWCEVISSELPPCAAMLLPVAAQGCCDADCCILYVDMVIGQLSAVKDQRLQLSRIRIFFWPQGSLYAIQRMNAWIHESTRCKCILYSLRICNLHLAKIDALGIHLRLSFERVNQRGTKFALCATCTRNRSTVLLLHNLVLPFF